MTDRTGAERQRRYIARLKEAAAGSNEGNLRREIERLKAKIAELTDKPVKPAKTTRTTKKKTTPTKVRKPARKASTAWRTMTSGPASNARRGADLSQRVFSRRKQ
jgi:hypothetical protein